MRLLALLLLACAAAPALANHRALLACSGGEVCQVSKETATFTQCQPLADGTPRFCDGRCNAGAGNSGACNTCPTGFNTKGSPAYVTDARACKTDANPDGQVVNPYGTCGYPTCTFVAGSGKNPGYYACTWKTKTDGSVCNDGKDTTTPDQCLAGQCVGTTPTCPPAPNCYEGAGTWSSALGACTYAAKVCDDGNKCTTDSCDPNDGQCKFVDIVTPTCTNPLNTDCYEATGTCSAATGTCAYTPKAAGAACDDKDGDKCTSGTCQLSGSNMTCQPGARKACNTPPNSDCYEAAGTCSAATGDCSYTPKTDGTLCTADADLCTTEACLAGQCTSGPAKTCSTPPDACKEAAGTCDATTGACTYAARANGVDCGSCSECHKGACIDFAQLVDGAPVCFLSDTTPTCP